MQHALLFSGYYPKMNTRKTGKQPYRMLHLLDGITKVEVVKRQVPAA
jgi:hypothetical protein